MMSQSQEPKKLFKSHNHLYYWIYEGDLYEAYQTIRAQRVRFLMEIPGFEDSDRVSESVLKSIKERFNLG